MSILDTAISALLWSVVPLVFSIAFFLWWRRLRHWSFALLSLASALGVIAQVGSFLTSHVPPFGKTPEEAAVAVPPDIPVLVLVSLVLQVVVGIFLLIGAFGFLSAARDELLWEDAKKMAGADERRSAV